jgi:hypothetical protein
MTDKFLRRYTNIPSLLYLLRERKITLLDPETWDDKNDAHYLSVYREKKSLQCVLALCFTQVAETYHHWRVFANGSGGICIRFDRAKFMAALGRKSGVRMQDVAYLKMNQMRKKRLRIDDLPFLKRYPYEDEREFRAVYESAKEKLRSLDIGIPLNCIDRVILSPWMPQALAGHVKLTIREIGGCGNLDIARSTLISNETWKKYSDKAK